MMISKKRYLQSFALLVLALAVVRAVMDEQDKTTSSTIVEQTDSLKMEHEGEVESPDIAQNMEAEENKESEEEQIVQEDIERKEETEPQKVIGANSRFFKEDGTMARHRIVSVRSYSDAFPDGQDTQILAARKWGVKPVANRIDAENRKSELVYVSSNPYFFVEPLYQSIPYLVPRASALLQDIGRCFFDSLQIKGMNLHKIIITSVLRTKDDVTRLRRHNGNATENSCHMYGTTFDIAYNRYLRVEENDSAYSKSRTVADVRLKQILSEVLNDQRKNGKCYVKYEVKQGCYHITVR